MQIFLDERTVGHGVDILVDLTEMSTPTSGELIRGEYWAADKHNGMLHVYYFDGELYPQCNEDQTTAYNNCLIAYGLSADTKQVNDDVYVGDDLKQRIAELVAAYDLSKVVAFTPGTM